MKKYDSLIVKTNHETAFDSRWSELKIDGKNIPSRSNHVSAFFDSKLFVHGGYDADKGVLSDFYVLDVSDDVEAFEWKKLPNQLDGVPLRLKSHTAITYKTWIIMFGGETQTNEGSNNVYCYDIIDGSWRKVKTESKVEIPKLDSHAVTLVQNKMMVYGGYISDQAVYNNNIYCLDLDKMEWQCLFEAKKGVVSPEGRSNLGLVNDGKYLWVFGGITDHHSLDDLWKFDLALQKWEQVESKNVPEVHIG